MGRMCKAEADKELESVVIERQGYGKHTDFLPEGVPAFLFGEYDICQLFLRKTLLLCEPIQ